MQHSETLQKELFQILRPFVPEGHEINIDTDLVADLDLDSMKVMDIVTDVEDAFDISVPLNILPDIRTIGDFTVQIQKLLEEGA
jgi:acyl carrier protein